MTRRQFLIGTAALAVVPIPSCMNLPNFAPLGARLGGRFVVITVPDPLPGINFTYTQPTDYMLEVTNMTYQFTADANAASRTPRFTLSYQSILFQQTPAGFSITANQSMFISFENYVANQLVATVVDRIAMGSVFVPPGCLIQHAVNLIQVGDRIQNIVIMGFAWPLS